MEQVKIKFIVLHIISPLLLGILIYFNSKYISGIYRNYLPDACWSYSFSSSLFILNTKMNLSKKLMFLNVIFIFYEKLQQLKIVKGTFDLNDIFVYSLFSFFAYYFFKKTQFKNYETFKSI